VIPASARRQRAVGFHKSFAADYPIVRQTHDHHYGGRLKTVALMLMGLVPALAAQERPWSIEHLSSRIPRSELDAITTRGREIAAYDAAAWHGTDAVLALHPAEGRVRSYVARRRADDLWEVTFGRLSVDRDTFVVAYRAVQARPESEEFHATAVEPAEADTGHLARAARALDLAAHDLGRVSRPYNRVILAQPDSSGWYVYLMPAPTRAGYWPLGADTRYRVSRDGQQILEKRRLHNTVLEYGPPGKSDSTQLAAGYHSAVLDDRPEDTDVFLVLSRTPLVPEYIVSRTFYFRIDVNGQITAYDRDTAGR
jgi:hypothetical protein